MMVRSTPPLTAISTVQVSIKARVLTVKGARGTVVKDLSHMSVEMQIMKQADSKRKGNFIRLRMWFGQYKQKCQVRTCKTLITNLMNGVVEVSIIPSQSAPKLHPEVGVVSLCVFFSPFSVSILLIITCIGFRVSSTR